jgi:hypothetical protein
MSKNESVWLLAGSYQEGRGFLPAIKLAPYLGESGGRNWVRTSDPSLVRRNLYVA